jgi:GYF domain 2
VDFTPALLCVTRHNDDVAWGFGAGFSIISAIICALLAPRRGRSGFWWFFIGGALPWISILILYLIEDLSGYEGYEKETGRPVAGAPGLEPPPPDPGRWPSTSDAALALPQDGWFYAARRRALGPVSIQYLRGAIETGTLPKRVPVWCSAFRDWVTPERVPGFFG